MKIGNSLFFYTQKYYVQQNQAKAVLVVLIVLISNYQPASPVLSSHHAEGASHDGEHLGDEVVPGPLLASYVHRHGGDVVGEPRLGDLLFVVQHHLLRPFRSVPFDSVGTGSLGMR